MIHSFTQIINEHSVNVTDSSLFVYVGLISLKVSSYLFHFTFLVYNSQLMYQTKVQSSPIGFMVFFLLDIHMEIYIDVLNKVDMH